MTAPRTSKSHPIRVDWLRTPGPERLGLTLAPGKRGGTVYGEAPWRRDLDMDLDRLTFHYRVQRLVCLAQDHELAHYGILGLLDGARERGLEVRHFPIADQGVPEPPAAARALVEALAASEKRTIIHCIGGLGRTGTVAGCVLVELGRSPDEALAELAEVRSENCPENDRQRAFIREWAGHREATP